MSKLDFEIFNNYRETEYSVRCVWIVIFNLRICNQNKDYLFLYYCPTAPNQVCMVYTVYGVTFEEFHRKMGYIHFGQFEIFELNASVMSFNYDHCLSFHIMFTSVVHNQVKKLLRNKKVACSHEMSLIWFIMQIAYTMFTIIILYRGNCACRCSQYSSCGTSTRLGAEISRKNPYR